MFGLFLFFFKQKTAYELRISDWSSDVCSSDLNLTFNVGLIAGGQEVALDAGGIRATTSGKTNIIAATAIARGDLRTLSADQAARVKAKMAAIVADPAPGTGATLAFRSEERRVGRECVRTC